jgi:metallophosphoesterase superfamily enzyme
MRNPIPIRILDQQCWLSPERCLYWEEEQILVVSDLHFGKTGHFRKAGIGVPQDLYKEDLFRLLQQAQHFQPKRIILTGDLFHSRDNLEIDWFGHWRDGIPTGSMELVMGNHDRLPIKRYEELGLVYHDTSLRIGPFLFVHDLEHRASLSRQEIGDSTKRSKDPGPGNSVSKHDLINDVSFTFSGHLHPGIRISGSGKQSLRFPCFYFSHDHAILPAFSKFTGLHLVRPSKKDRVFAVLPGAATGGMPSLVQIQ